MSVFSDLEHPPSLAAAHLVYSMLEDGAPILISEISEDSKLRVIAEPRAAGSNQTR